MVSQDLRPTGSNTVLLFGPQALSFDEGVFRRLTTSLSKTSNQQWVLKTIKELPAHWEVFRNAFPHLSAVPGRELLHDLVDWFLDGSMPTQKPSGLPNVLLSPLVVIAHLAQYAEYMQLCHPEAHNEDSLAAPLPNTETLGFCTGILSATVVSCSTSKTQFSTFGATAIRLAVLIGGLVDAEDARDNKGKSGSLAAVWKSHQSQLEMTQILKRFPEAYISVNYDEHRATITASQESIPTIVQQLKGSGILASEIGLQGRFHCLCYRDIMEEIFKLCDSQPALCFPHASSLVLPTRSNAAGGYVTEGHLHEIALQAILVDTSNWYQTIATVHHSQLLDKNSRLISIGPERCIPPSFMRRLGSKAMHFEDLDGSALHASKNFVDQSDHSDRDQEIAVVGMACTVAGADDLEEFWKILSDGRSQHQEVPHDRVTFETTFRNDEHKNKWYGNFIKDAKAFDHKFFKKSPREAASMDPQQRLLLQVAYQAVEQSGYFQSSSSKRDANIGCYIGVCATDYENNIACHEPNAFSATGNLRSFIAGKISHYFGWTGPGLTIDTACSASAVAIHQACVAILSGECSAALAGGTNMITQPLWFQNLAGASFLSPTGQCKPFDAAADGYCRGEAIAGVFLKKMSLALEDGDQIFGSIPATAVYQNQNCTPIFVPNAPSLSDLFRRVVDKSGLEAKQISVVEAHGTGTPVGDPAEYESIRRVFGGHSKPLQFSSVKGLIGHTEGASGVVSLIKVLLMIQEGYIPPQASFSLMSSTIQASPSDRMEIPTSLRSWDEGYRAALINNYGASGSNASLVVTQAPKRFDKSTKQENTEPLPPDLNHPFWFSALDDRSLRAYTTRFRRFLRSTANSTTGISMADLSFNVSRQSNRSLDRALLLSCRSIDELDQSLAAFEEGVGTISSVPAPRSSRSVILCFGGQISTFVGLSRLVYANVKILQNHLDQCDAMCQSLGTTSIYPGIFRREPIEDPVELQTMLFAVQYASAKSWIDCGTEPSAVIGHSFGELTALCISGILSLRDALKMIIGRSRVIRKSWGLDKGAMLAVEGGLDEVEHLLAESRNTCQGPSASIACFNGPRSFTLAGSIESIDAVAETMSSNAAYLSMLSKRLNVTHAYHSTLVQPLVAELEQIGETLTFNEPKIRLERATEFESSKKPSSKLIAEHMRQPVYFNHAVRRLYQQFPSSIWLEASSNATITTMASRALGSPKDCHFQPVNISTGKPMQQLMDTTMSLWQAGLSVNHWAHSPFQTHEYRPLLVPPYQFDKQQHWMEVKPPPKATGLEQGNQAQILAQEQLPTTLYTFVGFQDNRQSKPRFRINTMIEKYVEIVSSHIIAQTAPICPATVQVDIAVEALLSIHPDLAISDLSPQIRNVVNEAPICIDPSRSVWIDYEALEADKSAWHWKIFSNNLQSAATTTHVTGEIAFRSIDNPEYHVEFGRYERLVEHARCLRILDSNDADDIIQGRSIYKCFSEVVDYGERFQGLQRLVGKGNESAGRVVKKHSGEGWLDPFLADCHCQVGGIWVNCMANTNPGDMYIANGFELWARSPKLIKALQNNQPEAWNIYAHHSRAPSGNAWLTDIFIFDAATGSLHEVILGVNYTKVSKSSMSKLLSRLTANGAASSKIPHEAVINPMDSREVQAINSAGLLPKPSDSPKAPDAIDVTQGSASRKEIAAKLKTVLADISGLETEEIKDDVELGDIGIDSLLGMEMAREIEGVFKCSLPQDELMDVFDFLSLMKCLQKALGIADDWSTSPNGSVGEESSDDRTTPSTSATSSVPSPAHSAILSTKDSNSSDLCIPAATILEAFRESKALTDQFIEDHRCVGYLETIMPKQAQLCVRLAAEAFQQLGCDLESAKSGQILKQIPHLPEHGRLVNYLYKMLEETRIIDLDGPIITRTAIPLPASSSHIILQGLVQNHPEHVFASQLCHWTGSKLADVLTGKADGLKLIFANERGRELVSGLYGDSLLNKLAYSQMADFLGRLIAKLAPYQGPLKILEMGAGTGGTTKWLLPLLARLGAPVEYTFTDLSSSFVAGARKRFKEYTFMKFQVHDIEKPPADEWMYQSQHIVLASNAVHATHSLTDSIKNIHHFLRPDGFLMMLEMTETLYWVDLIFGVLEGWWLFDDGRTHAIAHESRWDRDLQSVGYGHVDWTGGNAPETKIQRIFIALASGPRFERLPEASSYIKNPARNHEDRRAAVNDYVQKSVQGFSILPVSDNIMRSSAVCVLVTGATGSLGSHLVAHLAGLPEVDTIVCLNRRHNTETKERQQRALKSKKIFLTGSILSKLEVLEGDIARPLFGLPRDVYDNLCNQVTHIVHNAWPMSGKLPLKGFALQFQAMRNLVDLARDASCRRPSGTKIGFQLVSSIATVGHYPLWTHKSHVPEERMTIESVLPNGYGDAKLVCEHILDETLHQYPHLFRTMTVRLGQVAGSSSSGYWNHLEHFSFMLKSAQTLRALPDFDGLLSWTPVNDVAATMGDLLLADRDPHPIYHIDNPVRQQWRDMIPVLAGALGIPRERVVPFGEWIRRVKAFPGAAEWDNPAVKLVDFLEEDFERMSCGGVLMGTERALEHSRTLRSAGAVGAEVAKGYVQAWKDSGFLRG